MAKEYLFIGGPHDGRRIATNGHYDYLLPDIVTGHGWRAIDLDSTPAATPVSRYVLRAIGNDGACVYLHEHVTPGDMVYMLLDGYRQPAEIKSRKT